MYCLVLSHPWRSVVVFGLWSTLRLVSLQAQQTEGAAPSRAEQFAKQMTGVTLQGTYTDGSGASHDERYDIEQARPLGEGGLWLFSARIRYGDRDVTLPVPLQVKWLGQIPVITLEQVTLPGLGTFTAYVIIDGDRYAGTWRHDETGGHMFGKIERSVPSDALTNER